MQLWEHHVCSLKQNKKTFVNSLSCFLITFLDGGYVEVSSLI